MKLHILSLMLVLLIAASCLGGGGGSSTNDNESDSDSPVDTDNNSNIDDDDDSTQEEDDSEEDDDEQVATGTSTLGTVNIDCDTANCQSLAGESNLVTEINYMNVSCEVQLEYVCDNMQPNPTTMVMESDAVPTCDGTGCTSINSSYLDMSSNPITEYTGLVELSALVSIGVDGGTTYVACLDNIPLEGVKNYDDIDFISMGDFFGSCPP